MDERIKGEYRKIYSELVCILMIFTAGSLLVKFILLGGRPETCVTEMAILIFSPLYMAVRQYMLGIAPEDAVPRKRQKINFLAAVAVSACAYVAVLRARGRMSDGNTWLSLLTFVAMFTFVYYVSRKLGSYFAEKKSRKYED